MARVCYQRHKKRRPPYLMRGRAPRRFPPPWSVEERRLRRIGGASGAATQIKVQDVMGEPWGKLQY
jgi:hypothetical protein